MPYLVYGIRGKQLRYLSSKGDKKIILGTKKEAEKVKKIIDERQKSGKFEKGFKVKIKKL